MSIEREVRVLQGTEQQKQEEVKRQIRAAILPFFADTTDNVLPAVCTASAEHSYVAVTNAIDLTVIWDSWQGIAIVNYPNVGYIERPHATRLYFLRIAEEMGLGHLIPDKIYIALVRTPPVN